LFSQRVLNQTVALVCAMNHFILAVCFVLRSFFLWKYCQCYSTRCHDCSICVFQHFIGHLKLTIFH